MSDELVIAVIPGTKIAKPYPAALARRQGFEVLEDEPVYKHGRVRTPFRVDGRPIKPKRNLKPAAAIPTPSTHPDGGEPADTEPKE
jgi:hypothetical protein